MLFIVFIALALTAFVDSAPEWDDLRVTWGPNIYTKFNQQPRTVADAKEQGFKLVGPAECGGSGAYNGNAFIKNDDYALTLLYDKNGFIAGIQHGITKELAEKTGYPSKKLQPPFVFVDNRYVISAYFTDPSKICTEGRSAKEFKDEGTGTDIWLQTGNTPSEVTLIPKQQKDVAGTKWVEGKCFITMGVHYWYDIKPDMDCDTFLPVFLLYNGGELNAFGWAFLADLPSPHYEHPGISVIGVSLQHTSVPENACT
ncbi:hypothetical protein RRG08_021643 [Elysia crispata]|uniref:Uncharacterized protein n=1 Tax=Elysia crispata TaxID=231223 RepID=A0AAE0XDM0_9GAST|nr:hypothetical protein RRG08_021643 [Elysia crispata]